MIIGNFTTAGERYTGTILTLTMNIEAVFEPIEKRGDMSPDYRITAGDTDIGAAWKQTSKEGKPYLSVSLDDPSFPAPSVARARTHPLLGAPAAQR